MVRIISYPIILVGGTFSAGLALSKGVGAEILFPISATLLILTVAFLERLIPHRERWNQSNDDVKTDIWHNIVTGVGFSEIIRLSALWLFTPVAASLSGSFGQLWPTSWPIWAQLCFAVLVAEFGQYWAHRLSHEWSALWRWHAVHHSPKRLYWLNSGRDHPIGYFCLFGCHFAPLVILGCPAFVVELFGFFALAHGLMQHSNIDLAHGPFNWIFSTADLHRWHHSELVEEANANYGTLLITFDLIFGTYFLPHTRGPETLGVGPIGDFPKGYWGQILWPFRWRATKPIKEEYFLK